MSGSGSGNQAASMMAVEELDAAQSQPVSASKSARSLSGSVDALLVGCIVASELPLLITFFRRLWANAYYGLFPLVLLAAAGMLYARWPARLAPLRPRDRVLAFGSLALGFVALAVGVALWSPWFAAVGTLLTTLFLLIHFAQGEAVSRLGSAWLLLWLLLPLPAQLDRELTLSLQNASGYCASAWLDALGYNHVLSGQVIHLPGKRFVVEEACSVWHSSYVLLCLAAILVAALRYPVLPSLILLLSTVGWAIVANTLSILLTVTFFAAGMDISAGPERTMLTAGILLAAILLIVSTDRFLLCMFAPVPTHLPPRDEPVPELPPHPGRPLVSPVLSAVIIFAFVSVGLAQAMPAVREESVLTAPPVEEHRELSGVAEEAILPLPGRWSLVSFERQEATSPEQFDSAVWTLQLGSTSATLSLRFPFGGWPELARWTAEQGWDRPWRRELREQGEARNSLVARVVELENSTGDFGYMVVGLFDSDGQSVAPPAERSWSWQGLKDAVRSRFTHRGAEVDANRSLYECRLFVTSKSPFAPDDRASFDELYFSLHPKLAGVVGKE